MKKSELENRLVNFSVDVISLTENLKEGYASQHLAKQLIRSGTSSALNYGEAQGAPTKKDFIHKISIVLRELRESQNNLRIIYNSRLAKNTDQIESILDECSQLTAIFTKTFQTARNNEMKEKE
jgi:four helix bundle protein